MDTSDHGEHDCGPDAASESTLPDWITNELIKLTNRAWAKRSSTSLSKDEAAQLILTIGRVLDATGVAKVEVDDEEEVHRLGEGEQP